jgi:hypothetical protein
MANPFPEQALATTQRRTQSVSPKEKRNERFTLETQGDNTATHLPRRPSFGSSFKLAQSFKELISKGKSIGQQPISPCGSQPLSPAGRSKQDLNDSSSARSSQESNKIRRYHLDLGKLQSGTPTPNSQCSPHTPVSPTNLLLYSAQSLSPQSPQSPHTPQSIRRRIQQWKPIQNSSNGPTPRNMQAYQTNVDKPNESKTLKRSPSAPHLGIENLGLKTQSDPDILTPAEYLLFRLSTSSVHSGFSPSNPPLSTSRTNEFKPLVNPQLSPKKSIHQKKTELRNKDLKDYMSDALKIWGMSAMPDVNTDIITNSLITAIYLHIYSMNVSNKTWESAGLYKFKEEQTKHFLQFIRYSGIALEQVIDRLNIYKHCFDKTLNIPKEKVIKVYAQLNLLTDPDEYNDLKHYPEYAVKLKKGKDLKTFLNTVESIMKNEDLKFIWQSIMHCFGAKPEEVLMLLKKWLYEPAIDSYRSKMIHDYVYEKIESAVNLSFNLSALPHKNHNWIETPKGINNFLKTVWHTQTISFDSISEEIYKETTKYLKKNKSWKITLPKTITSKMVSDLVDRYKQIITPLDASWLKTDPEMVGFIDGLKKKITIEDIIRINYLEEKESSLMDVLKKITLLDITSGIRATKDPTNIDPKKPSIQSLSINGEPFFTDDILELTKNGVFTYFCALFTKLYQAGLDPHRKIEDIENEVNNILSWWPKRHIDPETFSWSLPLACCLPNSWGFAHEYFKSLYPTLFSKHTNQVLACLHYNASIKGLHYITEERFGSTQCEIMIMNKSAFKIAVTKQYSISIGWEESKIAALQKLADCSICWTLYFENNQLKQATLNIPTPPTFEENFPQRFKRQCEMYKAELFRILINPA